MFDFADAMKTNPIKANQSQTNSKRVGWGLACGELVEPYPTNSFEKSLHFQDEFDNLYLQQETCPESNRRIAILSWRTANKTDSKKVIMNRIYIAVNLELCVFCISFYKQC